MKHLLLTLSCAALLLLPGRMLAQEVAAGGIKYFIDADAGEAVVVGYEGEPVDIAIPATVEHEGTACPVTAIGDGAFMDCSSLESVKLPEGVASIGDMAFIDCYALSDVTLPTGLTHIGIAAFMSCNLARIDIPEGVTAIPQVAFCDCELLESVTLPSTLEAIGEGAFAFCLVKEVNCRSAVPPSLGMMSFTRNAYTDAVLHVPEGAMPAYHAARGWMYFFEKTPIGGISYVLNPDTREAALFDGREASGTFSIPVMVEHEGTSYAVTAIGDGAFMDSGISAVSVPEGVTIIDVEAFGGCTDLESVTLPSTLETLGEYAFGACWSLPSLELPAGITSIPMGLFVECNSFSSYAVPEGVESIGDFAFESCKTLESVTLPSTLSRLGEDAFLECPLKDVDCLASVPPAMPYDAFDDMTYLEAVLHVPAGTVADYQSAEGWMNFRQITGEQADGISVPAESGAPIARYSNGIVTASSPARITVYAQSGAKVLHAEAAASLSLAGLPHGLYIISVAQGGHFQALKVAR